MAELESSLRESLLPRDDQEENHQQHFCLDPNEEVWAEHRENSDGSNDLDSGSFESGFASLPPHVLQIAKANVRKTLCLTFFTFTCRSIWNQSILSIFIVLVWKDRPEYVGYVFATIGMLQVLSSIFTRYATRRCDYAANRGKLFLFLASVIGLCAMGLSLCAIQQVQQSKFHLFLLANGLWGMSWGFMDSTLPIVFTDSASADPKTTTKNYELSYNLVRMGNVAGLLVPLFLFERLGNTWNADNCVAVMTVGLCCNLPVVILLCSLRSLAFEWDDDDDDDYYGSESCSEPRDSAERNNEEYCDFPVGDGSSLSSDPVEINDNVIIEGRITEDVFSHVEDVDGEHSENTSWRSFVCANKMRVPLLMHTADAFSSFAGGVSMGYFPVFLFQHSKLGPVALQVLFLIVPLGQWASPLLATSLAAVIGPCRTCISLQWTYVACMLSMIACQSKGYPVWTFCSLYVLHGSLMNSTSCLSRAVFRQYVPTEDLHKWVPAENIEMILWSCAGLVGGYIVGQWGMLANFFVTAGLQFLASVPLAILYCVLDPRVVDVDQNSETMDRVVVDSNVSEYDGNYCGVNGMDGAQLSFKAEASSPSTQATEISDESNDTTISIYVV